MSGYVLSQDAAELDLEWVEGDPISMQFDVADIDWSGDYLLHIKKRHGASQDILMSLTVLALYALPDTTFTLTASAAANVLKSGEFVYDMQQVGGVTRLRGKVLVRPQVTA